MKHLFTLAALLFASTASAQVLSPDEAIKRMKLPEGFRVSVAACEPMIRQPLSVSFDERGRMWVLQYLQYPNPAGLKALKQDRYLRTVWDRVPEAPPKGPKGMDRITICYEPDTHGRYQKSKDFLSDLNLCSGFCIGNGGVYVLQSPYLLFYADKNRDDIPDGDPEVLLTGFGFDDTHSVANSLQWGPDGWLYGAAGSTSTSKIKNPAWRARGVSPGSEVIEFQQGVWRYHPRTKRFELFSEGGGNTFGLDFDKNGQCITGTNWGGKAMLHQMQGAYYVKGFSKHGPLHNPHAYGYFDHVPYKNFKGGHVTCGGIVYQADQFPEEYRNQYIAGNLLSNAIYWHKMTPKGSSFEAEHGGDLLTTDDPNFRPVDCFQGPDGCVYVADWHDKRAAHLDPIDNWDKTTGRIYKIEYVGNSKGKATPQVAFDLSKKTSVELVELLRHPNKWWRNEARRVLSDKEADKEIIAILRKWTNEEQGPLALEALWALSSLQMFDAGSCQKLLQNAQEHVRAWAVRLSGEPAQFDDQWHLSTYKELSRACQIETSPIVLCQMAGTSGRVSDRQGLSLALSLASRENLPADDQLPLMIWWAIESNWVNNSASIVEQSARRLNNESLQPFLAERIARRTAVSSPELLARLLPDNASTDSKYVTAVLNGMNLGLETLSKGFEWSELVVKLRRIANDGDGNWTADRLLAKLGDAKTIERIRGQAKVAGNSDQERLKQLELLASLKVDGTLPILAGIIKDGRSESLRVGAFALAQSFGPLPGVLEDRVVEDLPQFKGKLRQAAFTYMLSRQHSAHTLLTLVESGQVNAKEITPDDLRPALEFNDPAINKLIEKHWGKIGAATPGEKQARISWLNLFMNRNKDADMANGKAVFTKSCAACHTLFGEGGKVGPDLTSADRKNRGYLLSHIVDPSLYVRPEFVSFNITMADGRKLAGLVSQAMGDSLTISNVVNDQVRTTTINKANIDEMLPSATSLMPEKALDSMKDEEVRDLFAYLQSDPPVKGKDDKKLKVLLISGSLEYKSDDSLAAFQKYLEANYPVECVRAFRKADDDVPGLDALGTCDVAVFFTRRLTIKGEPLEQIKKYAASGKPIVGIRTASHGFQNWLEMDKEVFGGSYGNHYKEGPKTEIKIVGEHPILKDFKSFASTGSLYKNPMNAKDVTVLLTGTIPDHTEPIAWVRERNGSRVFYTSLGHPDDFKEESFKKMLANGIMWSAKR